MRNKTFYWQMRLSTRDFAKQVFTKSFNVFNYFGGNVENMPYAIHFYSVTLLSCISFKFMWSQIPVYVFMIFSNPQSTH